MIWIVNPFDRLPGEPGLPGRYASLSEVLTRRGHKVLWWSSDFSHRTKTKRRPPHPSDSPLNIRLIRTLPYASNVSIRRLISHREFAATFFREACELLNEGQVAPPDHVVVSAPPLSTGMAAFRLRERWGCKVIVDIQDAWPETFRRVIPGSGRIHDWVASVICMPWSRLARQVYTKADAITAVARTYVDLSGAVGRGQRLHVTPIGVPLGCLDPYLDLERRQVSPFTFVYLGSMSTSYDLSTVLRATQRVSAAGYRFRVIFLGGGSHEPYLRSMAMSLGVGSVVEFRGYADYDEVARALGESHVALNPVWPASCIAMPSKVGDYLGAGLPVINSIPGELAELLREADAGTHYRAGDSDSMAAAMTQYLDHPENAQRQGRNARRLGETMFCREVTYPRLAAFIETT